MSHEYKILNFGTIYFIVFFMCADKADENLPGGKQDYRNQSILIALNIENVHGKMIYYRLMPVRKCI